MIRILTTLLLALALVSCVRTGATKEKRYEMKGVVKSLDPKGKMASIDAEKIGDWMEAMEMEYPIKPDAEFQKLHVGDKIAAVVVVSEDATYYVTDVKVAPR